MSGELIGGRAAPVSHSYVSGVTLEEMNLPGVGWFAFEPKNRDDSAFPWQPALKVPGGPYTLDVWFDCREACERFIRVRLAGQVALEIEPKEAA